MLTTIDKEFERKYPGVNVTLQTAANVNGPYETLLQQTVGSGSADIVTANTPFQPLPLNASRSNETPIQYWATAGAFAPLNGQSFVNDYSSSAVAEPTKARPTASSPGSIRKASSTTRRSSRGTT